MKLSTLDFSNGSAIPSQYSFQGANKNPQLKIEEVPEGTQSLSLIVEDPDAPRGIWTHWLLWNLPPNTHEIPEGYRVKTPVVEGTTSFGSKGYGGPCPPSGTHRYFFKLFALNQNLTLDPGSVASELEAAMEGKILATAELMGTYQKK